MFAPVEAQPPDVTLDGIDEFLLLLHRIGVVEAQVAAPAEFRCDPEVQADRLGVPDMQVAVRFGRDRVTTVCVRPASRPPGRCRG